ncbi:fimbria/pilus periplasmic chaperone [Parasphingorhabdus sp.]|jgi:fimbrial chaperone protein|uniref:fimbria/pilus periplasmic chaperone n=1 Tax=Parasphingorhabdus sp. TaxID=2709688 RepID=UPI0039E60102
MRSFHQISAVGALAALMALCAPLVGAHAQTVKPLVVDLTTTGRGMNQTISVENTSAAPLPVEMTVQELLIDGGETQLTGTDPGDIFVFPPQATIQPGQTQTFRVQYVGDPALANSKHYYVTVAQVPVQSRTGASGVQVVFNFQVLASVGPSGAEPALRVQSAAIGTDETGQPVPVITMINDSATYGYLANGKLRIIEKDVSGREIFRRTFSGPEISQTLGMGLISSGQQRVFTLSTILPQEGGVIEARFTPDR